MMFFFGKYVPEFITGILETLKVQAWLQSLIIDGVVASVGTVLGFYRKFLSSLFVWEF